MKAILCPLLLLVFAGISCTAKVMKTTQEFTIRPIGWVRKDHQKTTIVLKNEYQSGLLGLGGFSHVYVLYWFDRNDNPGKRSVLRVYPRGNRENPLTGVFATRSPARPNLVALSLCKIVQIKENVIEVDDLDAWPNTPVLDLKPFIPHSDVGNAVVPNWVGGKAQEH